MGQTYVPLEEFLVEEANDPSGIRREWVDGHVYAMSGATPEHGRLVGAVIAELRTALRGRCTVRDGSVAVHVAVTRSGLRPDVSVVCGPIMKTVVEKNGRVEGEAITNPCILVEVLSESTERDDRGWKFRDYRTLSSLDEYVLVSQATRRIEVFRRSTGWQCEPAESGATITLHGVPLSVDAIYDE
ncbi:MAG: Uma2 family endonuclease [Labilithrix sp.]|nr:Uma2 family endonuclease [Labilithrix sp.]MCW5809608.1 Uma2 family endonuclease [Labilithrix sp.]